MREQGRATARVSANRDIGGTGLESPPPLRPKDGVLVLGGYGIRVAVERGQLLVVDGIGGDRRQGRLARATCRLSRLVVLGHAGTVSLEALRWLHDVGAAFVQIDPDGEVIAVTAPAGLDDARLRRAQALATTNGVGLEIARDLLRQKLEGQRQVLERVPASEVAIVAIEGVLAQLATAESVERLRIAESQAAAAYWSAWAGLPVRFATKDVGRVPPHWLTFGARTSPLTNSPRSAANSANAVLNYLYAILEAEARIACLTLGLDPGMGLLHADLKARDSLALDLMEAVRPLVDGLVLDLLGTRIFGAKDVFETRQGVCRLMPPVTRPLAEHAPILARWVAPYAERAARAFGRSSTTAGKESGIATPLTQANRSKGRDGVRRREPTTLREIAPALPAACQGCGVLLEDRTRRWCDECLPQARAEATERFLGRGIAVKRALAAAGRDPSHTAAAEAKRGATRAEQRRLELAWEAAHTEQVSEAEYRERVLPGLASVTVVALAEAMGVSTGYAATVKQGRRVPHPRHWEVIAGLAAPIKNVTEVSDSGSG